MRLFVISNIFIKITYLSTEFRRKIIVTAQNQQRLFLTNLLLKGQCLQVNNVW